MANYKVVLTGYNRYEDCTIETEYIIENTSIEGAINKAEQKLYKDYPVCYGEKVEFLEVKEEVD